MLIVVTLLEARVAGPQKIMAHSFNVLFICSGNSCRSIMAEAIFRKLGDGRFQTFSAASRPTGLVNSMALAELQRRGYQTTGLSSKSWDIFTGDTAVKTDFVITVCDLAALEVQPKWPGSPVTVWWNFRAPGAAQGTDDQIRHVFQEVCHELESALKKFALLPFEQSKRSEWASLVHCIPVKY